MSVGQKGKEGAALFVPNHPVVDGAPLLGHYADNLIPDAIEKGFLAQ